MGSYASALVINFPNCAIIALLFPTMEPFKDSLKEWTFNLSPSLRRFNPVFVIFKAYFVSKTPLPMKLSFSTNEGYRAAKRKLSHAPHEWPTNVTGKLLCFFKIVCNSWSCPSMDADVCNGSKIPRTIDNSFATGAISPGAPGPPWITATEKGPTPYFLKFFISSAQPRPSTNCSTWSGANWDRSCQCPRNPASSPWIASGCHFLFRIPVPSVHRSVPDVARTVSFSSSRVVCSFRCIKNLPAFPSHPYRLDSLRQTNP